MRNLSLMPWVAGGATGIGVAYGRGFHLWAGNLEHKHWVSSLLLWHCLPSRVQNWLVAGDHCPLEWVTELQVKVPEGEPVGGSSNICSSPTECFPLQSLKVLHYSRGTGTLERRLLGDVCQLPHFLMCCCNYLVAVIKWIPHTEGFMLSRISSASYETHHVGTNIYFFFLKPQAVCFLTETSWWGVSSDSNWMWLLFSASLYAEDAALKCGSFPVQGAGPSESLGNFQCPQHDAFQSLHGSSLSPQSPYHLAKSFGYWLSW